MGVAQSTINLRQSQKVGDHWLTSKRDARGAKARLEPATTGYVITMIYRAPREN